MKAAFESNAERAILGGIMFDAGIIDACVELNETHFSPENQPTFNVIADLHRKAAPIALGTVTTLLAERKQLDAVGGALALTSLVTEDAVIGPDIVAYYVREIISSWERRASREIIEKLHKTSAAGEDVRRAFDEAAEEFASLQKLRPNGSPLVRLMDISAGDPDPRKTVLGDRFLCVGGGMLFVGPSGIGKSSASVQQDILWGLGRAAFGIRPARPLRILTIQAENDDEDLAEMREGVCRGLGLSAADRESVRGRVFYETVQELTGSAFLAHVDRRLALAEFDLLRIDPFLAYLGSDITLSEKTAAFLRSTLNPILTRRRVACIINHHTPKVTNRDTSNWRGSDWAYAGAGSADVTNWARAALVIDPTHTPHVFKFIAAKRGSRIGWESEDGEKEVVRHYCHAEDGIYWRASTGDDIAAVDRAAERSKSTKRTKFPADLKSIVPEVGSIEKKQLLDSARKLEFTKQGAADALNLLLESGELFTLQVSRANARPEVRISRQSQPLLKGCE